MLYTAVVKKNIAEADAEIFGRLKLDILSEPGLKSSILSRRQLTGSLRVDFCRVFLLQS